MFLESKPHPGDHKVDVKNSFLPKTILLQKNFINTFVSRYLAFLDNTVILKKALVNIFKYQ
jgi:hypothetical protein